ncbi:N/A [soil metagenome]
MRFCMITTFYPPYSFGGDATYVRALSRSLVAQGHDVTVIACRDAFDLVRRGTKVSVPIEENGSDGVTVHWLQSDLGALSPIVTQQSGHLGLKGPMVDRILSKPFDVINFHNISLVGGPAILKRGIASIRVYSLHEHWLVCPTHIFWKNKAHACDRKTCISCCVRSGIPPQIWRYTGLRDRSLSNIDLIFSPSDYTAERHREGGIEQPITILPLFSSIGAPVDAEPAYNSRPSFLFVGRVTVSKGIQSLLRVAATLVDFDFLVVGEGDLLAQLQIDYAHCPNIKLVGGLPQPDLVDHYRQATALVFPSLAPETFGLAIVEAAACGTPAIVSNTAGGAVEIVQQTGGGVVYNGDNELIAMLCLLGGDRSISATLGERAQQGYRKFYTRETHLKGYLDAITTTMKARRLEGVS